MSGDGKGPVPQMANGIHLSLSVAGVLFSTCNLIESHGVDDGKGW
jgi:hypothetical protein